MKYASLGRNCPRNIWCQEWKNWALSCLDLYLTLDMGVRVHGILGSVMSVAEFPVGPVFRVGMSHKQLEVRIMSGSENPSHPKANYE